MRKPRFYLLSRTPPHTVIAEYSTPERAGFGYNSRIMFGEHSNLMIRASHYRLQIGHDAMPYVWRELTADEALATGINIDNWNEGAQ